MEFNFLGVAFVSEKIPNHKEIEIELDEFCEYLRVKAQYELDDWLKCRGLEQIMGVVVKKGSIK